MRGSSSDQAMLLSDLSPAARGPATHPVRSIKAMADAVWQKLSPTVEAMDSQTGRPSIPPERLLKGEGLLALFSVRSHRLFCEMVDDHILFRWFLDRSLDEPVFDHSTFSQNSERVLAQEVARKFFDAVVGYARGEGLLSDEHVTVDGTLIEAWASLKSVTPKEAPAPAAPPDDPGNPTVDFHGDRRTTATHQSTTDPEALLARKRRGKEAKLCFSGQALMENRQGLCVDLQIAPAPGPAERDTARRMLRRQARRGIRPTTVGAAKGDHCRDFVRQLRQRGIRPHLACIRGRRTPGLDGRTTRHEGDRLSQRLRKKVEEIFGWMKMLGGGCGRVGSAAWRARNMSATWSARRITCCVSVACGRGQRRYEGTRDAGTNGRAQHAGPERLGQPGTVGECRRRILIMTRSRLKEARFSTAC